VAYDLTLKRWGKRRAIIGIVHTTPSGKEFYRPKVFEQLNVPLDLFSDKTVPISVGGDYYLTAEAAIYGLQDVELDTQAKAYVTNTWKAYKAEMEELAKKRSTQSMATDDEDDVYDEEDEDDEDDDDDDRGEDSEPMREIEVVNKFDVFRNEFNLTFAKFVQDRKLQLLQPVTGTNWKTKEVVRWRAAQIADFYVIKNWQTCGVGIVDPVKGIALADAEDMRFSQYWRLSSDHWPVGAYLCTATDDKEKKRVEAIFHDSRSNMSPIPVSNEKPKPPKKRPVCSVCNKNSSQALAECKCGRYTMCGNCISAIGVTNPCPDCSAAIQYAFYS